MSRQSISGRGISRAALRGLVRRAPRLLALAVVAFAAAAAAGRLDAQRPDTTKRTRPSGRPLAPAPVPACCKVVALDSANRMVTARETATGYAFRFRVYDARDFTGVAIGDPVWADFANRTVRIDARDPDPCCTILSAPPPADPSRQAPRHMPDDPRHDTPPFDRP